MKKFNSEALIQLAISMFGYAAMIAGLLIYIASFIISPSNTASPHNITSMNGLFLFMGGLILFSVVRNYFLVLEAITTMADVIKSAKSNEKNTNTTGFKHIVIDENTKPEEISFLKENFPEFKEAFSEMINKFSTPEITNISDEELTMIQLNKAMEDAIKTNNFERAAKIRDEINRRKL